MSAGAASAFFRFGGGSMGLPRKIRSMAQRNAESVFPEPVGATTRACLPAEMASHAPACAGVGVAKALRNQSCVAGPNRSSTSATPLSSPVPPTSGSGGRPGFARRSRAVRVSRTARSRRTSLYCGCRRPRNSLRPPLPRSRTRPHRALATDETAVPPMRPLTPKPYVSTSVPSRCKSSRKSSPSRARNASS